MKTVFALASLFVAVQAMPQGSDGLPSVPACLDSCVKKINDQYCPGETDKTKLAICGCQHQDELAACAAPIAATACSAEGGLASLIPQQASAVAACSALLAKNTGKPVSASASATGKETGASATPAVVGGSSSSSGSDSGSGSGSATETASATGGETAAVSSGASESAGASGSSGASATSGASGASGVSSSPTATGSAGAADRVAVGGSVILAAFAAVLAL